MFHAGWMLHGWTLFLQERPFSSQFLLRIHTPTLFIWPFSKLLTPCSFKIYSETSLFLCSWTVVYLALLHISEKVGRRGKAQTAIFMANKNQKCCKPAVQHRTMCVKHSCSPWPSSTLIRPRYESLRWVTHANMWDVDAVVGQVAVKTNGWISNWSYESWQGPSLM